MNAVEHGVVSCGDATHSPSHYISNQRSSPESGKKIIRPHSFISFINGTELLKVQRENAMIFLISSYTKLVDEVIVASYD